MYLRLFTLYCIIFLIYGKYVSAYEYNNLFERSSSYDEAKVIILNKVNTKKHTVFLYPNSEKIFEKNIILKIKGCWSYINNGSRYYQAMIRIKNINRDFSTEDVFSGWIFSNSINLTNLEHPLYDIKLLSCDNVKVSDNEK